MPDPFDADRARRALDEVPAPDLWSEAHRRADDDSAVALVADGAPGRPGRWLTVVAVAAVAVLAVGTATVLLRDDPDQGVDAGPTAGTPPVHVYQDSPYDCAFGVTGDALETGPQVISPFTELTDGTNIEGPLGVAQAYRIDVPGIVVTDLIGERVEDVELRRGSAQIWFGAEFVQVRWFTGGQDPCGSFTVTVSGGTEDGNRHAAVELAERIVLPNELNGSTEAAVDAVAGEWQLDRVTVGGTPTDADDAAFSFAEGQASWSAGCNDFRGGYQAVGASSVRMRDVVSTTLPCPMNPIAGAVETVMGAEEIAVTKDGLNLVLRANDAELVLRPATDDGGAGPAIAGTEGGYAIWPMTAPESVVGYLPEFTGSPEEMALSFAREVLDWTDATVVDREPSEDGRNGSTFLVASAATERRVEVSVGPGDPADINLVYRVNDPTHLADPDATASVGSVGSNGIASVTPVPEGTVTSTVTFTYGEYSYEGPMGEDIELLDRKNWDGQELTGAVLIVFRDDAGQAIGAWGRALPAGDFAAG